MDLALDTDFDFELSYVEMGMYRIDMISESTTESDYDIEPDIDDTSEMVNGMSLHIDRILKDTKHRTNTMNALKLKLKNCNHNVKEINDIYEELNEYI